MNVHIVTLGCSKNIVDSETLSGILKAAQIDIVDSVEDASAVVINTCGFIETAREESIAVILQAAELRRQGSIETLLVVGCLSERYPQELRSSLPEVDHFFGTESFASVLKALGGDPKYVLHGERRRNSSEPFAYLKVSEGCDNVCSFCAIPLIRGRHRSKPIGALLDEAKALVNDGSQEIILVAQDLSAYGTDIYGHESLPDLLTSLSDQSGANWIRCMYAYPSGFPTGILSIIRQRANICNYLDMPLQHISDRVLKSMRRGISARATLELIDQIRQSVPGIVLRTTLIVGYPNETDADFEELCRFVEDVRFDRLGVFEYSQEEGTYAEILGDPISSEEKERRRRNLMDLQSGISAAINQEKIGTRQVTLIEEIITDKEYRGRTEGDAPEVDQDVYIRSDTMLTAGSFAEVEITDATEFDLFAKV